MVSCLFELFEALLSCKISELERKCAELFGKESALFVASGTMGNLLSIMSHTERGDEIIVGRTVSDVVVKHFCRSKCIL